MPNGSEDPARCRAKRRATFLRCGPIDFAKVDGKLSDREPVRPGDGGRDHQRLTRIFAIAGGLGTAARATAPGALRRRWARRVSDRAPLHLLRAGHGEPTQRGPVIFSAIVGGVATCSLFSAPAVSSRRACRGGRGSSVGRSRLPGTDSTPGPISSSVGLRGRRAPPGAVRGDFVVERDAHLVERGLMDLLLHLAPLAGGPRAQRGGSGRLFAF